MFFILFLRFWLCFYFSAQLTNSVLIQWLAHFVLFQFPHFNPQLKSIGTRLRSLSVRAEGTVPPSGLEAYFPAESQNRALLNSFDGQRFFFLRIILRNWTALHDGNSFLLGCPSPFKRPRVSMKGEKNVNTPWCPTCSITSVCGFQRGCWCCHLVCMSPLERSVICFPAAPLVSAHWSEHMNNTFTMALIIDNGLD